MITAIYVVGVIVLIGSLIGIFLLLKNDKLNTLVYKIDMCEKEMNDHLKMKEENVLRLISIINRQLNLDLKEFEKVKNLKASKVNNIEKDKILTEAFDEIKKVYVDNSELSDIKSFDGILKDIDNDEISLISLRTLYNKSAGEYNMLLGKFPFGIISKFRKLTVRPLYQGKELQEVIEKELSNLVI